ncbi:MAG: hypothetical protein ABI254_03480 [Chthoniobacterales bacterium]
MKTRLVILSLIIICITASYFPLISIVACILAGAYFKSLNSAMNIGLLASIVAWGFPIFSQNQREFFHHLFTTYTFAAIFFGSLAIIFVTHFVAAKVRARFANESGASADE